MRNLFRFLLTLLSFKYNEKIYIKTNNLEKKIYKDINKKLKLRYTNRNISKTITHRIFSRKLYKVIKKNDLSNFLRFGFIQKIFFVHNRIYIFFQLLEIYFDKLYNKLWKKLLIENLIGNPIRYFLFPKSSGNRIREIYHLKKFSDYSNLDYSKIDLVLELGGGYGCMCTIFKKINSNAKYIILDLPEVNLLQYYYLKNNNISCSFSLKDNKKNVYLISEIEEVLNFLKKNNKKNCLLIANWSLSETPLRFRKKIKEIIHIFSFAIISYQSKFETIDNHIYFKFLKDYLKNFDKIVEIFPVISMNFLYLKNKYFYFFVKKQN